MAQTCKVCAHLQRYEIDAALLAGVDSQASIAQLYGLKKQNVQQHKVNHLQAAVVQREHAVSVISGTSQVSLSISDQFRAKRDHAESLGKLAEAGKDWKTALLAIREWRQLLETQERILTKTSEFGIDVTQLESWRRLSAYLADALGPVPGGVEAVRQALARYKLAVRQ